MTTAPVPPAAATAPEAAGVLQDVAAAFADIGREVGSVQEASGLDAVVQVARARVNGTRTASITVLRGGDFTTVAATDDLARRADQIQYALRSGPCVDAIAQDTVFNPADLRTDRRWPQFGPAVADLGLVSMLSYRLVLDGDDVLGALNLYSDRVAAFGGTERGVGLLLSTHAAAQVSLATARARADNLARALESNREIGIAMGVLMTTYKVTRDEAFDLLRIASQNGNRKLHAVAAEVADTGVLAIQRPTGRGGRPRSHRPPPSV